MRRLVCSGITWALLCLAGCSAEPPNLNPRAPAPLVTGPVDFPRYMGRWYVIANIPYVGEHDYVGSYAQRTLRDDGLIDDAFLGRRYGFD
ncbi:Lipocalin family protein [Caballeronia choica]|jgi:apolipoprotein D and lipocalin family protein|uniref:Lipocalin family protein n=1 Tax=Caballeronia choica TaxID=326476 RepID=A0A158FEU8_9BURK|nr:Lipocalin family protein [Caballeronia choica]